MKRRLVAASRRGFQRAKYNAHLAVNDAKGYLAHGADIGFPGAKPAWNLLQGARKIRKRIQELEDERRTA